MDILALPGMDTSVDEEEETYSPFGHLFRLRKLEPYRFEPSSCLSEVRRRLTEAQTEDDRPPSSEVQSPSGASRAVATDDRREEQRVGNVRWCTCETCEVMERPIDCLCCRESCEAVAALEPGQKCITEHKDFSVVCLHPAVLRVCLVAYSEYRGTPDPDCNR